MANDYKWLKWISEIQAIAQAGLSYTTNEYDIERYVRLRAIAAEIAADHAENTVEEILERFTLEKGYTTPKVDVRAFILHKEKVLLVKERTDGLWSLPGGWADVNESPSETIIRETKEETGFDVSATKLLAFWDILKHDHPLQWPHIYKCVFHCQIIAGDAKENLEISEIDFFDIHDLPPLSLNRITEKQIQRLYELVSKPQDTEFD
ncbi:bifunctional nicotinamide mononucleotide adenylyltransferase/ADP-ribose pyrophosphatase [Legionella massiliensis]|uniref:Bifunctional nicotinamide mononucleotide adenylyltransferase/ADP-ribose pyrophosphatase n=1 Tax=Legionella massiliensis TaxID=1034943 RepID=A0A078L217_9GAMM|nr:NUDIX hydrolase [Legionella massiliensis]CDZ79231.1 bifunctional nicotinamide mononucleotide adenylyltransferase/ADP-ribose pyrophosphatase [Legionella massiliensis]CEE14969.1 RNA pyrophosphohydrolase [Legionella massiliensis]